MVRARGGEAVRWCEMMTEVNGLRSFYVEEWDSQTENKGGRPRGLPPSLAFYVEEWDSSRKNGVVGVEGDGRRW